MSVRDSEEVRASEAADQLAPLRSQRSGSPHSERSDSPAKPVGEPSLSILKDQLELKNIRDALIRQEDTIIFGLVERSQFKQNRVIYESGAEPFLKATGKGDSFLEYMLVETERLHARVRRYTAPDEHAFFPERLPSPLLPALDFPELLFPCNVNMNQQIMSLYTNRIVPVMCKPGDDAQYGSSVVSDVNLLQAISKRVHYGMLVAESKFRGDEQKYTELIEATDEQAIMKLLTNEVVEERVLKRVGIKAATFGRDIVAPESAVGPDGRPLVRQQTMKLNPTDIVNLYRDLIIPLTKEAEVAYLLQRLGNTRVAYHGPENGCSHLLTMHNFSPREPPVVEASLLRCSTAAEVFGAVLSNRAFFGVAALDLGDGGIVPETLSLLRESPLRVVGELEHASSYRFFSPVELKEVRFVRGRADALRVCATWLHRKLSSEVEFVSDDDPTPWAQAGGAAAASTAYVSERDELTTGAFKVVEAIDGCERRFRGVVLSKRKDFGKPTGNDKTLLLLVLSHEAGKLASALATFNNHTVNLLYILSSVEPDGLARFYTEISGHVRDEHVARALDELRGVACLVKVLGSYTVPSGDCSFFLG